MRGVTKRNCLSSGTTTVKKRFEMRTTELEDVRGVRLHLLLLQGPLNARKADELASLLLPGCTVVAPKGETIGTVNTAPCVGTLAERRNTILFVLF